MLKVLIIDDEPYVREGLKHIIDWEENGFEICGEAADGDEGYSKILDLKPDIILIDIRMPGKLGIDIIKDSKENGVKGKFIVISGYSNFEYAQKAIKYGVKEYLLKPIDEDELLEIALKLKKEIEEEKKNEARVEKNKIALRQYVLTQLILKKDISEYEDIKNNLNTSSFQVALISNSLNQYNFDNIIKIEEIILENIDEKENIDIIKLGDRLALVIRNINVNYAHKLLNNVKLSLDKSLGGNNFIALGEEVNDIQDIYKSYRSAKNLTNNKFLFNNSEIASNLLVEKENVDLNLDEKKILSKIITYTEIGQKDKFNENLNILEKLVRAKGLREDEIKVTITRSLLDFKEKIKKDYKLKEENLKIEEKIIDKIYYEENLKGVMEVLLKGLSSISKEICTNSNNSSIKRVVKYVEKNYYKDLKLENLAEIFNYNSAYLGKIFKSYAGESFNTYLDKIRIEEGKKLLVEENLKVYEVCERIGYKNIDYFHSKFKKYVGISPLNYKKQKEMSKQEMV
ncbi:MAG: response regulator [Clostridium sp.]|uniref:response regulator transcription factor n=1 Tax=Clostridium sp. TaxID=1506 RepID=UPI001ED666DC|nr:response regulator [Clostridium sp.]MBS5884476.1 response regulator [Clostridium sp.]MDU7147793.1 response regulator [Clostridium sp.]MDU7241684.1 response regulator [Clostridium sp.]